jgi:hypothetical protein
LGLHKKNLIIISKYRILQTSLRKLKNVNSVKIANYAQIMHLKDRIILFSKIKINSKRSEREMVGTFLQKVIKKYEKL